MLTRTPRICVKKKEITPIIEEIFNESNQIFGASKINAILRSRGYVVADKTVAAIMHENGWFSVRGGAKAIYEMNKERKENMNSSLLIIYMLLLAANLAAYDIIRVSTNYLFIFIFSLFEQ